LETVPADVTSPATTAAPAGAAGLGQSSRWLVFGVMSIGLFMASTDATIVATALPTLHHALRARINWSGWTITAYQLGQTVAMPVAGRISDQLGRKRVFIVCVVLFTVSSLLCGLAQDIYVLVALRFVQALGGGAFMPSATGIIADRFGSDRDRAIGLFTSIFPLGALVGPVIGAVILNYWSWRGIFFVNVPIGAVLFVLAVRFLPASRPEQAPRTDLAGACLLGVMIFAVMYGVTNLGNGHTGFGTPTVLAPVLTGLALTVVFYRRAGRMAAPIIPVRLLRGSGFLVMNFINFVFGICALGFGALVPLYAQERYRLPALEAGTLLTARAVGMMLVAAAASFMLRRTGYRPPMLVGFGIIAAGLALLTLSPVVGSAYLWLAGAAAVTGLGIGMAGPASNNATLALAPADVAAIAGLRGMFRQAGAIIGVSATTAFVARSSAEGAALGDSFLVLAIMLVLVLPLVFTVPDNRGGW